MAVDLVFIEPPLDGPPYGLVFGEFIGIPPDVDAQIAGALPGLSGGVSVAVIIEVHVAGALPQLTGGVNARYRSETERPTVGRADSAWQVSDQIAPGASNSMDGAARELGGAPAPWQEADPLLSATGMTHADAEHLKSGAGSTFQDAMRIDEPASGMAWQNAEWLFNLRMAAWQESARLSNARRIAWQEAVRDRRRQVLASWQEAVLFSPLQHRGGYETANPYDIRSEALHQDAIPPPPGIWVRPPVPGEDPCYIPPPGGEVHLVFSGTPGDTHLLFRCETHGPGPEPEPGETIVIPVREVYVILNEASLKRVEGNIPLPNFGVSFGLDADSWTWTFNSTLPADQLDNVMPGMSGDPVIVEVMVNGVAYRMIVESVSRERTFGQASIRIAGRGINAVLDSPYSPVMSFGNATLRTAQQLMADVLTLNGVPLDWDVDWGLDDWNVPGGIWTYQGSYMGAMSQIAAAAGGYIQPDRLAQNLIVLPRYPVAPWNWSSDVTPDYEVPDAFATREGIEWVEKAIYNRVFVSGTAGGVLRRVTRTGTDGGLVAPTVVDSLVTDGPAGRQRGLSILSDTGRQARVTLRSPVHSSTGLIMPGKFVRYMEGSTPRLGIVRSMSVEVANPEIMQTITLETHLA